MQGKSAQRGEAASPAPASQPWSVSATAIFANSIKCTTLSRPNSSFIVQLVRLPWFLRMARGGFKMEVCQSWEGQWPVIGGSSPTVLPAWAAGGAGISLPGPSSTACPVPCVLTAVWVLHSWAEPRGPETIRQRRIMGLRESSMLYPAVYPDCPTDSAIGLLLVAPARPRASANTHRLQSKAPGWHFLCSGGSPMHFNII